MSFPLQARTDAGRAMVELAEEHAADFATRAAEHDADASYGFENIEALKNSGYIYAPVPVEFGGMGVDSTHDALIAASRLAQGDPSVSIGVNMHLIVALGLARAYRGSAAAGHPAADHFAAALRRMVNDRMVVAAAISEPNQDLYRPATTATPAEGGWVINGRKIFATMSPAATHLNVGLTYTNDRGDERYGFAMVPTSAPGIVFHDDWDAIGMRASGSGSISFQDCPVPGAALSDAFAAGWRSPGMIDRYVSSGPFHASASLGIAEAAYELALESIRNRTRGNGARDADFPAVRVSVAQATVELGAMQAVFGRCAAAVEDYLVSPAPHTQEAADAAYAQAQASKAFITETAIRVVNTMMTACGGSAYMRKNPLSRHYRDVRAGSFMHPLATTAALDLVADVTLAA